VTTWACVDVGDKEKMSCEPQPITETHSVTAARNRLWVVAPSITESCTEKLPVPSYVDSLQCNVKRIHFLSIQHHWAIYQFLSDDMIVCVSIKWGRWMEEYKLCCSFEHFFAISRERIETFHPCVSYPNAGSTCSVENDFSKNSYR